MKLIRILLVITLFASTKAFSADCDIQIEILSDKYMFGQAEKIENSEVVKKMQVQFYDEFMEVIMPIDGENYLIKVVNQNCQAYCTRAKRVRQLHSGDEKLVRNLFKNHHDDIVSQIKSCSK